MHVHLVGEAVKPSCELRGKLCAVPLNDKHFLDLPLYKLIVKPYKNFVLCDHPEFGIFIVGKYSTNENIKPLSKHELAITRDNGFVTKDDYIRVIEFKHDGIKYFKVIEGPLSDMLLSVPVNGEISSAIGMYLSDSNLIVPLNYSQTRFAHEFYGFGIQEDV
jgi:hypothetical protein